MTRQKKLLLVIGMIFAPVLALIAAILRAAALFTEYEAGSTYFADHAILHTTFLWVCGISLLLLLVFVVVCRKDIPAPPYQNSLSILFSSAFFIVALIVSALLGFLAIPAATTALTKFFWLIAALCSLAAPLYFAFFFKADHSKSSLHGMLGLAPTFVFLLNAMLFYFDRSMQMNAPAKMLHLFAFLLLSCYFITESRGILLQAKPALFCFLAAASLLFSAAASIPNLLYHLVAGHALALHSAYDFLLLAAALYTLARLLQMLPYERPAIHGLVRSILRRRADSAEVPEEEAIAPEEKPADILPPPEAEEPDEETKDDQ